MRHRSHRPDRRYAVVPNDPLRSPELSWEAKGLLSNLMSHSDEWDFRFADLIRQGNCGRDKMQRMLRELEAFGHLVREVIRGDGGHVLGTRWIIIDDPKEAGTAPAPKGNSGKPRRNISEDSSDGTADEENPEKPAPKSQKPQQSQASDREPENPVLGRGPENPAAGKPGPLRKTKSKKTKNPPNPLAGDDGDSEERDLDDDFDRFWSAYPSPVERAAARRAYEAVVDTGRVTPAQLLDAVVAYAASDVVARGFRKKPANWLADEAWADSPASWSKPAGGGVPSSAASGSSDSEGGSESADPDELARFWVGPVKQGASYCASGIRLATARRMLELGLVTEEELRRVGVAF